MIWEKFLGSALTPEEQKQLKEIDDVMFWYDLKNLLNETPSGEPPERRIGLDYTVRSFRDVEEEYLELFRRFSGQPE